MEKLEGSPPPRRAGRTPKFLKLLGMTDGEFKEAQQKEAEGVREKELLEEYKKIHAIRCAECRGAAGLVPFACWTCTVGEDVVFLCERCSKGDISLHKGHVITKESTGKLRINTTITYIAARLCSAKTVQPLPLFLLRIRPHFPHRSISPSPLDPFHILLTLIQINNRSLNGTRLPYMILSTMLSRHTQIALLWDIFQKRLT